MVSAGRFRNGTFQRNQTPQISSPPLPQAGSGSTRSLLDEYDRADWAQNQAEALEWGLQQEQITPGWLEPIGGTGLYISPNEPVDPTDCDRYPNSPYCRGSGVDPFSLGSLSPVGADITFTANQNGTEFCLRLDPSLFAVSLPPLDVCYRTPDARPFQPPTPPVNRGTQTPQDLQPEFTPFDFEYEPGACFYEVRYKGKVGTTEGPKDFVGTGIMGRPTVGGFWVWTINNRSRWRLIVPGVGFDGSTFNGGTDFFTYQPTFAVPPSVVSIRPLSILPNVCPAIEPPPNYRNLPQPEPRGENNPMSCCNTAEIEEMLRVVMLRLGTAQYPATVPESLADTEAATTKIENITDFLGWTVRQIDALTGQFPIEVEIKDADLSEEGNQTRKVKLPNLAESIAEIYALSLRSGVNSDIHTSFLMRLAAEIISTKNAALITQDYARANASYLGYKGNTVKRKVDYAFNVSNLGSLEKILRESSKTIVGWQDDDNDTVQSYLEKLMFAANIIKLTHFKSSNVVGGLVSELGNLLGFSETESEEGENESEDEWRGFLQEINSENGGFNRNSPIKPEVIDPTVSGETSVDTRFTGFDLIPAPGNNSSEQQGG